MAQISDRDCDLIPDDLQRQQIIVVKRLWPLAERRHNAEHLVTKQQRDDDRRLWKARGLACVLHLNRWPVK